MRRLEIMSPRSRSCLRARSCKLARLLPACFWRVEGRRRRAHLLIARGRSSGQTLIISYHSWTIPYRTACKTDPTLHCSGHHYNSGPHYGQHCSGHLDHAGKVSLLGFVTWTTPGRSDPHSLIILSSLPIAAYGARCFTFTEQDIVEAY